MKDIRERIIQIIIKPQLMSFATITEDGRPWVRYVHAIGFQNMKIMFSTFTNSRKALQIHKNPEVHITCGVTDISTAQEYLQICAKAKLSRDEKLRHRYWNDKLSYYYNGPDDPNYTICIAVPYYIELITMSEMKPLIWQAK